MPSNFRQIYFRSPLLLKLFGSRANSLVKSVATHPEVAEDLKQGICPICKKKMLECEYFQSLDHP